MITISDEGEKENDAVVGETYTPIFITGQDVFFKLSFIIHLSPRSSGMTSSQGEVGRV